MAKPSLKLAASKSSADKVASRVELGLVASFAGSLSQVAREVECITGFPTVQEFIGK
jgi:hypothetical protein